MYLKRMVLKNFRNYTEASLEFSPKVNILIGENAQGKTNLLEAIYVLAMTRSHRTNNERELINFEENEALLQGILERNVSKLDLELFLEKRGKKQK